MTIRTRGTLPVCAATVVVTLAGASLSIQHSYGGQAVAIDRGSRDYTLPDQMQWRETEDGPTSILYGDPSKPGLYAYIVKRGPNVWSKPYFHDNDRFVTVLEGTLWVGTGRFDPQRTVPLKAGSFVRDIARGIHFEGTKDDGSTLYFVGIGPAPSHPAEPVTSTTSGSGADVIDPAIRQIQRVEDMPNESFVLYGDSSKPGLYLQYQRRAPNNWSRPHYQFFPLVLVASGDFMAARWPERDVPRRRAVLWSWCLLLVSGGLLALAIMRMSPFLCYGSAVLVVGAPNSSNSRRLVECAQQAGCMRASLIEMARDIDWRSLAGVRRLGLSAGASAPEVLVDEVIDACRERFAVTIEEVRVVDENVYFRAPPPPLRKAG